MAITYTVDNVDSVAGVTTTVSNTLTVTATSVIVVTYQGSDNLTAGTLTISNSGTALTWNAIATTNTVNTCKLQSWWAFGDANGNRTVTVTRSRADAVDRRLTCIVHEGADQTTPVPAGKVASGTGTTDYQVTITPTNANGSALWAFAADWNQTNSFAAIANCTLQYTRDVAGQYTTTLVRPTTQPRTDGTAFTIGETDTAGAISYTSFEVVAAAGGSTPIIGWEVMDNDIYPPRQVSLSAPPAYVRPPTVFTPVSGIAWHQRQDIAKARVVAVESPPAYVRPPTVFTPVSGVAWSQRQDVTSVKPSFSTPPAFGGPVSVATVGISGIGFHNPPDQTKVKPSFDGPPAYDPKVTPAVGISGIGWDNPLDQIRVKPSFDNPPAYDPRVVPAVGISGIGWFNPWDQIKVKPTFDIPQAIGSPFIPAVGISGMGWYVPLDLPKAPKEQAISDQPAIGTQTTTAVPVSGMAWFEPRENDRLPKGSFNTDPITLPFVQQTITWSFLVGDTTFIPDPPRDYPPGFGQPVTTQTVTVSGMAWFTPLDTSKPRTSFSQASAFGQPAPNLIQGIGWFNPPDWNRVRSSFDISMSMAMYPPAPPVGIAGMAWFEPPPNTVKVSISFDAPPALQQPIIQIEPPAQVPLVFTFPFIANVGSMMNR